MIGYRKIEMNSPTDKKLHLVQASANSQAAGFSFSLAQFSPFLAIDVVYQHWMSLSPTSRKRESAKLRKRKSRANAKAKEKVEHERSRNRKNSQAYRDRKTAAKKAADESRTQQLIEQLMVAPGGSMSNFDGKQLSNDDKQMLASNLLAQNKQESDDRWAEHHRTTDSILAEHHRTQDTNDLHGMQTRNRLFAIFGAPTQTKEEIEEEFQMLRQLRDTPRKQPVLPRLPLTEPARTVAASLPIPKNRSATPGAAVTPMLGEVGGSPRQLSDPRTLFGAPLQSISNLDNRKMAPQQSPSTMAPQQSPSNSFGDFSIGRGDTCTPLGVWNSQDLHKNRLASFGRSRTRTRTPTSKHLSKSSVNRDKRRQQNASALIPPTPLFAAAPSPVLAKPTVPNPILEFTPKFGTIPEPPSSVLRVASIQQPKFKKGDKIVYTKANNGVNTRRKGEIVHVDTSMGQPTYYFDCYNHDGSKSEASTDDVGKLELFQE